MINHKFNGHSLKHMPHKDAMDGKYFCENCDLLFFIGSENKAYMGTTYDGIIVAFDMDKNMWVQKFNTCNEQIIKNLLE